MQLLESVKPGSIISGQPLSLNIKSRLTVILFLKRCAKVCWTHLNNYQTHTTSSTTFIQLLLQTDRQEYADNFI